MKRVLISDAVDRRAADLFINEGFIVRYAPGIAKEELNKIIHDFHALVVRSETKVDEALIGKMQNMLVIGRAGTGVDNIDVNAATRKGIVVMNTPGGNTISTAEHAMSLILSLCRNIPQADASIKAGRWDRKLYKGSELHNKTLGVIGLGKIGREVAHRAKGFSMQVIGYDPLLTAEAAAKIGVTLVDLDEIFSKSDIITVHVPLDENTKHLIRKETLSKCKDGVKIINCARGGIVHESDLVDAINSGKVSGAALDVYEQEPPDFSSELFKHPKIVTTPHLGASTEEAQEKVAVQIAEQIIAYFNNNIIDGAVNAAALSSLSNTRLAPYVKLAELMGMFLAQIIEGKILKIRINHYGELLSESNGLISSSVTKGFLLKRQIESVNLINASFFAREAGVVVEEIYLVSHPDYTNYLSVEFISEKETATSGGAVLGNSALRIVSVNNYRIEFAPQGDLLVYTNDDRPGRLASVSNLLAENNINVGGVSLGRTRVGEEALTIICMDGEPGKGLIGRISQINGLKRVFPVKF